MHALLHLSDSKGEAEDAVRSIPEYEKQLAPYTMKRDDIKAIQVFGWNGCKARPGVQILKYKTSHIAYIGKFNIADNATGRLALLPAYMGEGLC